MINIDKNYPLSEEQVQKFEEQIKFNLPTFFLDFYKKTNGAILNSNERYIDLWKLTEMIQLNKEYQTEDEFYPGFFLFASDGGGMAYAIQKETGYIYEIPFIGGIEYSVFICKTFTEFIEEFPLTPIC